MNISVGQRAGKWVDRVGWRRRCKRSASSATYRQYSRARSHCYPSLADGTDPTLGHEGGCVGSHGLALLRPPENPELLPNCWDTARWCLAEFAPEQQF